MSGGRFDYVQSRIWQAAEEMEKLLEEIEKAEPNEYGETLEFLPETIERFKECQWTLNRAAEMLQRVDWLVCSEDGEDSFHKRWEEKVGSNLDNPRIFNKLDNN